MRAFECKQAFSPREIQSQAMDSRISSYPLVAAPSFHTASAPFRSFNEPQRDPETGHKQAPREASGWG